MWQRGTSWGGLTTSSQVGLPTCATMPWLIGNTEPHPGGMLTRWVGLPAPALIPKFL